jgi:hypothetical protein
MILPPIVTAAITSFLSRKLFAVITVTISLAVWAWILAWGQVNHPVSPSGAIHYWFTSAHPATPKAVEVVSTWLREHRWLMTRVAFIGGAVINAGTLGPNQHGQTALPSSGGCV